MGVSSRLCFHTEPSLLFFLNNHVDSFISFDLPLFSHEPRSIKESPGSRQQAS